MTTWVILRAAGIGAYVMVFLSVAWGLVSTTGALGRQISKASATTIHQFVATCGLFLLAIHLGGLVIDSFMPFGVSDVMVPGHSSYRPAATAFGVIAMYSIVFVIVTSWMRKKVGTKWWRRSHLLAVPMFVLSMMHGVFAGSDSTRPWMWWTYIGTGAIVVFLVVVRGLTAGYRPERAERSVSRRSGALDRTVQSDGSPALSPAFAPARLLAGPDVVLVGPEEGIREFKTRTNPLVGNGEGRPEGASARRSHPRGMHRFCPRRSASERRAKVELTMSRRVFELALLLEEREAGHLADPFDGATRRAHPGETSCRGWATVNVPCTPIRSGHTWSPPLEMGIFGLAIPRSSRATKGQPNTREWEGHSDPFGAKVTGSIEP